MKNLLEKTYVTMMTMLDNFERCKEKIESNDDKDDCFLVIERAISEIKNLEDKYVTVLDSIKTDDNTLPKISGIEGYEALPEIWVRELKKGDKVKWTWKRPNFEEDLEWRVVSINKVYTPYNFLPVIAVCIHNDKYNETIKLPDNFKNLRRLDDNGNEIPIVLLTPMLENEVLTYPPHTHKRMTPEEGRKSFEEFAKKQNKE